MVSWMATVFPVASILNTHNFAIEPSDIEYYRTLFPDFAELTESYSLSGFNTLDGTGELTWYFSVYSLVCVPLTVLFKLIHVKTVLLFSLQIICSGWRFRIVCLQIS